MNETNVIVPVQGIHDDAELRLGRANGNVYHRIPGIADVHDGQLMVRLKKKRFVVLDYSIVPTEADLTAASSIPYIACPTGAGKQKCATPECPKVGVPVMLFDSNIEEPSSLYLRSGLCFTCQRNLNEKRRTQRKRKSDVGEPSSPLIDIDTAVGTRMILDGQMLGVDSQYHPDINMKRFKGNDELAETNQFFIPLNLPVEDTRRHGAGYEYPEIAMDIHKTAHEAFQDIQQLVLVSSSENPAEISVERHADINDSYEKVIFSLSKSIFLLYEWKASWNSVVTSALAEKASENAVICGSVSAEALVNATAVAVAQSAEAQEFDASNMIPLLMAAKSNGRNQDIKEEETNSSNAVGAEIFGV